MTVVGVAGEGSAPVTETVKVLVDARWESSRRMTWRVGRGWAVMVAGELGEESSRAVWGGVIVEKNCNQEREERTEGRWDSLQRFGGEMCSSYGFFGGEIGEWNGRGG